MMNNKLLPTFNNKKMKRLSLCLFMLSSIFLATSCSDDDDNRNGQGEESASLTVRIAGEPNTRYVGDSSAPAVESVVSNFTVFVFNFVTGDLERLESFQVSAGDYTRQVTGLSTGTPKRVVAFVNVPTGLDLSTYTSYSQLNTDMITLESQNSTATQTTGLFMSGETTESLLLSATQPNTVTIPVSRRVAKVVLTGLIINPTVAAELPLLTLSGVSIQLARLTGTPIGAPGQPTGEATASYAGGIASPAGATPNFNLTEGYLLEPLTIPAGYVAGTQIITTDTERYFYVLPDNGVDGFPTMLALSGTYGTTNPDASYYPIVINGSTVEGETDGTFVQSNMIYEISITMVQPGVYSEDPNVVPSQVALDVTITPQPWAATINQPVEW